jgi:hypothetical protein
VDYPPVRVFRFTGETFKTGIETHQIEGVQLRIYSPEKTIADCFKYRNKIGLDTAIEALKLYREKKRFKTDDLMQFARVCRVGKVMRPYLEVLLRQDANPRTSPHLYANGCLTRRGKRTDLLANCFNTSQWSAFFTDYPSLPIKIIADI